MTARRRSARWSGARTARAGARSPTTPGSTRPDLLMGPSVVWRTLVGAVTRADGALLRVRNSMTPGQRWTGALAMMLVIVVLAFGLPSRLAFFPGYAAAGPSATAPVGPAPTGAQAPTAPLAPLLQPPVGGVQDTGLSPTSAVIAPFPVSAAPATV